jgi:hypothetical protein
MLRRVVVKGEQDVELVGYLCRGLGEVFEGVGVRLCRFDGGRAGLGVVDGLYR